MHKITGLQVIEAAIELAEARPDHVYDSGVVAHCHYTPHSNLAQPEGCLFGQALMQLGVTEGELQEFENSEPELDISLLLEHLEITVCSTDALDDIIAAQDSQDNGITWGSVPLERLRNALVWERECVS